MSIKLPPSIPLFVGLAIGLATNAFPSPAAAQGTAFTYQGRLNAGTDPANGLFEDMRFHIYSAASGGTLIAGPVTNAPIAVTNGLFTVGLDFGAGVFTGSSNWLQIGVRTNGAPAYTGLSPRQQLTPTPYAILCRRRERFRLERGDSARRPHRRKRYRIDRRGAFGRRKHVHRQPDHRWQVDGQRRGLFDIPTVH